MIAIDGYVLTGIILEEIWTDDTNHTKPLFFLDEMAALESLQIAVCPKCCHFAYLHTH